MSAAPSAPGEKVGTGFREKARQNDCLIFGRDSDIAPDDLGAAFHKVDCRLAPDAKRSNDAGRVFLENRENAAAKLGYEIFTTGCQRPDH